MFQVSSQLVKRFRRFEWSRRAGNGSMGQWVKLDASHGS